MAITIVEKYSFNKQDQNDFRKFGELIMPLLQLKDRHRSLTDDQNSRFISDEELTGNVK